MVNVVALELIQLLMEYEVRGAILDGLVHLLRPTSDDVRHQLNTLGGQCSAQSEISVKERTYMCQTSSFRHRHALGLLCRNAVHSAHSKM